MNSDSDLEYEKYLKEKTLDELIGISQTIDKNRNRSRYLQVKKRITAIKRLYHIREDYIPRTRISSEFGHVWKFVMVPVMGLILLSITISMLLRDGISMQLFIPIIIGGVFFMIFRLTYENYPDVEMDNDYLYVSKGKFSERILRSHIQQVSENMWVNVRPITIFFKKTTPFGDSIEFIPKMRLGNPFKETRWLTYHPEIPPKHPPQS